MDIFEALFRWLHVVAGIVWIGMLYFFNWVNGAFAKTLDADTKRKVVPELMPRALFWFRWGAAWTWITGFVLINLVYYHGKLMFPAGGGWTAGAIVMLVVTFVAVFGYDVLHKALGKDATIFGWLGFVCTAIVVALMVNWGGYAYRAYNIHLGAMFGTIMAFNVWFRIWPAQRKIIAAIKEGSAPDPELVDLATQRSRHNTFMSLPLIWAMLNMHHTTIATAVGLPDRFSYVLLLAVIAIGWHVVSRFYGLSAKVKGV